MRLVLVMLLLISGCVAGQPQRWQSRPEAPELIERIAEQSRRYTALDAVARVGLTRGERYFSSRQFLLLERPDRLRLDALSSFGQLLLQLTSDGRQLNALVHDQVPPRFIEGAATSENLTTLTRVPLDLSLLLRLLLYAPPLIDYHAQQVDADQELMRLRLTGRGEHQEFAFLPESRLSLCSYYVGDELRWAMTYDDFDRQDGFPRKMTLQLPAEQLRLTLDLSQVILNPSLDPQRFHLQPPAGVERQRLPGT